MLNLAFTNSTHYTISEKKKIWEELDKKRRTEQYNKQTSPLCHYQIYRFKNETYYKINHIKGSYYIKVSDYEKVSLQQIEIELYHFGYMGVRRKRYYAKRMKHLQKILLCNAETRDYFKPYPIEKIVSPIDNN